MGLLDAIKGIFGSDEQLVEPRPKLDLNAYYNSKQHLERLHIRRAMRFKSNALALRLPPPDLPMVPPTGQIAHPNEQLDTFVTHPEVALGPQKVINIYRAAEWGWTDMQADLFTGVIELDGHLRSLITARQLSVAGKTWQLTAGGDDPASILASDMLEQVLREQANPSDLFAWVLGARYHGYSGTEVLWKVLDGDVVPDWFLTIPFRRFRFTQDGQPLFREDTGEGIPLQPGKFCFATNSGDLSSSVPRSGLMRTALWYSLFKRWSWRDWVIYAEKFGIPLVMGIYDADEASAEAIARLEEAVENIGEDGQATMPSDVEVKIQETQKMSGGDGLHASIVQEANIEMSKLITGSPLLAQAGGPGATFALGKVQQGRAFDLVLADETFVAEQFNRCVAVPFMRWNGFGSNARPPLLQIHVSQETDPLTRAKIQQIMALMGLDLDTQQLRTEHQLRKPPSEERTLKAPTPAPSEPSNAPTEDPGDTP